MLNVPFVRYASSGVFPRRASSRAFGVAQNISLGAFEHFSMLVFIACPLVSVGGMYQAFRFCDVLHLLGGGQGVGG